MIAWTYGTMALSSWPYQVRRQSVKLL